MRKPETTFDKSLYVLAFLCLSFGVLMFTIFASMELGMPDGQAATMIFLGPAVIAWLFHRKIGGRGWLITALTGGGMALFVFTVWLAAEDIIHPALLFMLYAFTAAGVVFYVINHKRGTEKRPVEPPVEWEQLGSRKPNPADRDVPRAA